MSEKKKKDNESKAESSDSSLDEDDQSVVSTPKKPEKRAKTSSDAKDVSKPASVKKVAEPTPVVQEDETKGESKNQRRKRERKEKNKLTNKQAKVVAQTSPAPTVAKGKASSDQKDMLNKVLLTKQASKDGKIKSKNFNLFAQFDGKKAEQKAVVSDKNSSDSEISDEQSNQSGGQSDDEVSEKLKKQIHDSINSYSLDNANSEDKTSPKNLKTVVESPSQEAAPADEEISDFSSEIWFE